MSGFVSPGWFLLLLAVATIAAGYLLARRRRHKYLMRFASLDLLESVMPRRPGWYRHVAPALLLVGLAVMMAGPDLDQVAGDARQGLPVSPPLACKVVNICRQAGVL